MSVYHLQPRFDVGVSVLAPSIGLRLAAAEVVVIDNAAMAARPTSHQPASAPIVFRFAQIKLIFNIGSECAVGLIPNAIILVKSIRFRQTLN